MPDQPMYTTRREFLGLTLVSAASTLPVFLGRTAWALAADNSLRQRPSDSHRILVVVQLAGGNDGLNTVIPYENDFYYRYRPQIGVPKKDVLPLTGGIGLHPAATALKALYDDGRLAIVQGVGYPNPNRSHFVGTDIWETGDPVLKRHDGWLGRYLDAVAAEARTEPEPIDGIALVQDAPLALRGERFSPLAFSDPNTLTWRAGQRDERAAAVFDKLNNRPGGAAAAPDKLDNRPGGAAAEPTATSAAELATRPTTSHARSQNLALRQFLERSALDALDGADEIRAAAADVRAQRRGGPAGGPLGQQLQMVARMIRAELPTRIYYVALGGFDTHSGQAGRQPQLLRQLGDAVQGLLATLADDKTLDRVLVMTFSEFGRRVQENASGGTDHGEAAPMFLAGSRLIPGLHEPHPDLANLHRGDLAFGCDFRRVYATVLRQWLGMAPEKVLGGGFEMLRVVKV